MEGLGIQGLSRFPQTLLPLSQCSKVQLSQRSKGRSFSSTSGAQGCGLLSTESTLPPARPRAARSSACPLPRGPIPQLVSFLCPRFQGPCVDHVAPDSGSGVVVAGSVCVWVCLPECMGSYD